MKRKGPIFLWIVIVFFLLLFGSITFLYFNAEKIVNENLSEFVFEKTDSVYRLNFDTFKIDFLSKSISVSHVLFYPDSIVKDDSVKTLYHFESDLIKLSNLKIFPLIRESRLVAESFKIESPEIRFTNGERVELNKMKVKQLNPGDTLVIPVFAEIFFDTLKITNAQINIDPLEESEYEMPAINLLANHFKIGGEKFTESPYPFDVSDLSLTVDNYKENLPDQLHRISIQQINLSLIHSTIKALNVKLEPVSDSIETIENRYYIDVPEIKVISKHIEQLHNMDTISIQKMDFLDPHIQIKFGTKVKEGTPPNEIDFYKLTGNKLDWIKVKQFSISNADVKFTPSHSDEVAQHFKQLFINFYDFKVDSSSYRNPERILSSSNINLSLSLFTLFHTDKVHEFTIEKLEVDSRSRQIGTGKVEFKPVANADNKLNTTINVTSNGFVCKNVDFLSFYHKQKLPMEELILKAPKTSINYHQKNAFSKKKKNNSLILDKTKDYLKGIYVGSAKISEASIEYKYSTLENKEGFFKTGFNFELTNLSVDSATFEQSDKIFFADNFIAKFNDLKLQLADDTHRLLTESIYVSSTSKSAEIINMRILPITDILNNDSIRFAHQTELFDIHFPRIRLNGANLHQAFFDKKLYIHSFNVYNPTFNIEKYGDWNTDKLANSSYQKAMYAMISDFLFNIDIRNLNMENGELNLTQYKIDQPKFELANLFSIKLNNFELNATSSENLEKLFFSDDIDLVLKDHSFTLADGVHKLDAAEIGILSSEKRVYITDANLYPNILSEEFKNLPVSIFAEIPEMEINNADIFDLFNKGHLPVNQITITKPNIKLLFQETDIDKAKNNSQKPVLILDDLKSVSAQKIKIIDGYLELAHYDDFKSKTFANSNLDFDLDNFKVTHQSGIFETSYSDFSFDLKYVQINLPDEIHTLDIDRAKYHLKTQSFDLSHLSLSPVSNAELSDKKQFYNLQIPKIELKNINLQDYIEKQKISASRLILSEPSFKMTDNRIEEKSSFSPYELDLYPSVKSFTNSIDIGEIELLNGDIDIQNDKPFQLQNINFNSVNFSINEENTKKDKLLLSDAIDVSVNNLKGKTKGGFFTYKINRFNINEKGNFSISGVSLKPEYSQKDFALKQEFQADYFDIENADFKGSELNLRQLFENKALLLPKLEADFIDVKIHRDKTFPLTPNIHTKLPQEALRDLKMDVKINQTSISVNEFIYTELESGAIKKSFVNVTDGKIKISNITNIRQDLLFNPNLKTNIKGSLMGAADVNINMSMNVMSLGNEFVFNAICGPMPLSILNPITEPGLKLSIKEGYNKNMEVFFEANEDSAMGSIRFEYNDLKISFLNTRDGEVKEGKFLSFLVNSIALRTDNPKPGRILIPAKFENHRDKQKSVVGYCWRSIYAGIKSTLGVKEKEN